MIEFSEQNNLKLWLRFKTKFKNNIAYRISTIIVFFWLLTNIVLFSLIDINTINLNNQWRIISGFNLGSIGSLLGFLVLAWSTRGLFSNNPFRKALSYFTFLFRILIYGVIIALAICFNFFNLFSIIAGFSLLLIAVLSSEFLIIRKAKKESKKC